MFPSGIGLGSTIIARERPVFYTGIDQHRLSSVLTTFTPQGERLRQMTLPNDRGLLSRYFAQYPGPHQAVVEATGRWYWLRDLLAPQGIDLHLESTWNDCIIWSSGMGYGLAGLAPIS